MSDKRNNQQIVDEEQRDEQVQAEEQDDRPKRLPICFFIPPPMFAGLAQDESNPDAVRGSAANAVLKMQEISEASTVATQTATDVVAAPSTTTPSDSPPPRPRGTPNRQVYDLQYCNSAAFPGVLTRSEGEPPVTVGTDTTVDKCYETLGIVHGFFYQVFNRDSIDDAGCALTAIVHYDFYFPSAFWNPNSEGGLETASQCLVFGDGFDNDAWNAGAARDTFAGSFGNFVASIEVVAHEVTHGIVQRICALEHVGEAGALHEHLADVFGSLCEQWHRGQSFAEADWLLGEDLVLPGRKGTALRSMRAPGTAYDYAGIGRDPQVDHYSKVVKTKDASHDMHVNSGIPNRAFYRVAEALGGKAWDVAGGIWWAALNDRAMSSLFNFRRWADLTVKVARTKIDPETAAKVRSAWIEVGVLK